jgi:CRP/FNR family transcriptional regulator
MSDKNFVDSCKSCIVGWKNFKNLSEGELKYVNENRYEAGFRPGEIMIKQGSPTSNALFLSSGLAKIYIEGPGGKNFIIDIAKPGHLILGPGAFVNLRNTYTVSSITAVHACFISFEVFRHLIKTNSAFAESMLEDLSNKYLMANARLVTLAHKRMSGRLADALIYFSDEVFVSDEFDILLSRQELGDFTNMAKECVVRIIREFEDTGLIEAEGSKIRILDREKIVKISETG